MTIATTTELICFLVLSAVVVIGALGVVLLSNIVYSAFLLGGVFTAVAGLYLLLNASFVAMAQILVYVGAINVLILFAIMLVNKREDLKAIANLTTRRVVSAGVCAGLLALLVRVVFTTPWSLPGPAAVGEEATAAGPGSDQGVVTTTRTSSASRPAQTPADTIRRVVRLAMALRSSRLFTSMIANRINTLIAPT